MQALTYELPYVSIHQFVVMSYTKAELTNVSCFCILKKRVRKPKIYEMFRHCSLIINEILSSIF